jgi:hypothetical protein
VRDLLAPAARTAGDHAGIQGEAVTARHDQARRRHKADHLRRPSALRFFAALLAADALELDEVFLHDRGQEWALVSAQGTPIADETLQQDRAR